MHIRELVMGSGCILSCPRGNVLFCRYILSASLTAFLFFSGGETEHSCMFFSVSFFGTLHLSLFLFCKPYSLPVLFYTSVVDVSSDTKAHEKNIYNV